MADERRRRFQTRAIHHARIPQVEQSASVPIFQTSTFRGGIEAGARVAEALELAWIGGSLGSVQTLVAHPATTTQRQMEPAAPRAAGIPDGLLRVAVGLEDPDDLLEDFDRALEEA